MTKSKTVYILDDDSAVRDALSVLIKSVDMIAVEFSSADEFLTSFDEHRPSCLITDVYLPGMDGVALQKKLIRLGSRIPILVMSGHGDIPLAVKMIQRGAIDFIEKPFSNHHMLKRIHQALEIDSDRRSKADIYQKVSRNYASLTPREKEVLEYLISGSANKVIAAKISVSPRTVETHRANILRKMQSESVVTLVQQLTNCRFDNLDQKISLTP